MNSGGLGAGDLNRVEWVFAYGSLMWRPGFDFIEQRPARLAGFRRRACIYSRHHRGTPQRPGLVLGLDTGDGCAGIAFRFDPKNRSEVIEYLDERELVGYAYRPMILPVDVPDGRVDAYTYVADPEHHGYAGALPEDKAADIIMRAQGVSGLNRDYLMNTVQKLAEFGVAEPDLTSLLARVRRLTGEIEVGGGI